MDRHGPPGRRHRVGAAALGPGIRRLLRHPSARPPARGRRKPPVAGRARPRCAGQGHARRRRAVSRRHAGAAPGALGRLCPCAGDGRVLGGARGPAPRPPALPSGRQVLGARAARALATARRRTDFPAGLGWRPRSYAPLEVLEGRTSIPVRAVALALATFAFATLGLVARADAFVYFPQTGLGTIGRANLNGTGVNLTFISGLDQPQGMAVDSAHIYWVTPLATVARASLDGTGVNQRFISTAVPATGVAVDGAYVYWSNSGLNTIGRADLDGTGA